MTGNPLYEPIRADIASNLTCLEAILSKDHDADIQFRRFRFFQEEACLIYVEGLVNGTWLQDFILRPGMATDAWNGPANERLSHAMLEILPIASYELLSEWPMAVRNVLSGMAALLIDGCPQVAIMETRMYPARGVAKPESESAVQGPQEGLTEKIRDNVSMIRRYLNIPGLVTNMLDIGTEVPTRFAVLHVEGIAQQRVLDSIMQRIRAVDASRVPGVGQLQQLIEDQPYALLPQLMLTERPDKAAAALNSGQVVILSENAPYALIAPVTIYQLIQAPDDSFERWQYGSFQRIVRVIAILMSVYLPGLYVAIMQYHAHLLPMELLSSVAEARANVPFPMLTEVLMMEFAFSLINEAGIRIPRQIGTALGIVGALILGQAAVEARIISPIIIIIVAITGLGNYAIPDYGFSKGVEIYRLILLTGAAALGLPGIAVTSMMILCHLGGMHSFGVPYLAPVSPVRKPKPPLMIRWPSFDRPFASFLSARKTSSKESNS